MYIPWRPVDKNWGDRAYYKSYQSTLKQIVEAEYLGGETNGGLGQAIGFLIKTLFYGYSQSVVYYGCKMAILCSIF